MSDDHDKKKGRKKGAIWNHVITDPNGRVFCRHCNELIKIHFGEKVLINIFYSFFYYALFVLLFMNYNPKG